jgi:anti-sigma factor RsiW
MKCTDLKSQLPDLLLDSSFSSSEAGIRANAHLAECPACAVELDSLRATMQLMDLWKAPAPSAYFDTRMAVRMREEFAAPPAGLWQRLSDRFLSFGHLSHLSMKPVMAGIMTVAIVIGGATYAGVSFFQQPHPVAQESATLNDLQSLDRNAQTIDDLNSLDQQLDQQAPDSGNNNRE